MTYEEIKAAVQQFPVAERLRLAEEITDSVRAARALSLSTANSDNEDDAAWRTAFEAERARLLKDVPSESSAHRTFGMLRISAHPPTDEEIREGYTDYLIRKYS